MSQPARREPSTPKRRADWLLFAALMAGLTFVTHNVYPLFSHEDPGRDLYAVWRFLEGELPYRDFHWTYGPLYLVYAGGLFKILGPSVATAMLGYKLTQIASSAIVFMTGRLLFGRAFALAGVALHYYLGEINHTFNHGLVAVFLAAWIHVMAREGTSPAPLSRRGFALLLAVLMGLFQSKPNYGIACTAATVVFILLKERQAPVGRTAWLRLGLVAAAWPALAVITYLPMLLPLPLDRWQLCHAFGRGKIYIPFPFSWDQLWITPTAIFTNPRWALLPFPLENFLLALSAIATLAWAGWQGARWLADRGRPFPVLPFLSPVVLGILAHEFIMASLNPASLGYHISGFYGLVLAGLLRLTVPPFPRSVRFPTLRQAVSGAFVVLWTILAVWDPVKIRWRGWGQFLDHPRARIWYWGGPHPMAPYGQTLMTVTAELEALTRSQDACTILPRGSLYFFLAQRRRATWLEEADAQFLTDQPREEARMIRELASPPVEWILFSNYARYLSSCTPNNNFGEHYARDILKHVRAHYEEVSRVPRGRLHVYQDGEPFRNELHQIQFLRRRPPGAPPADLVLPVTAR